MSRAFRARPYTHWLALPGYSLNGRDEQGVQSETLHTLARTTWVFSERAWWAGRSERDPTHTDWHYLGILWTGVMSRAFRARPYTHWLALPGYSLNGRDEQGVQSDTLHTLARTTWVFSERDEQGVQSESLHTLARTTWVFSERARPYTHWLALPGYSLNGRDEQGVQSESLHTLTGTTWVFSERAWPYTHWLALPGYSLNGRDEQGIQSETLHTLARTTWVFSERDEQGVQSESLHTLARTTWVFFERARPYTHWLALHGYSLNGRDEQGIQSETLHTLTGTTWVFSERAWWAGRSERDPTHTGWHYLGILWTGVMSRAFRAIPYTHWLALPGYSLNGRDEQGVQSDTLHTLAGTTWVFSERARPYTHWLALPGYSLNGRDPTHTGSHYLGILWTGVMSRAFRASPCTSGRASWVRMYSLNCGFFCFHSWRCVHKNKHCYKRS